MSRIELRRGIAGLCVSAVAGFVVILVSILSSKHPLRRAIIGVAVALVGFALTVWWASRESG